MIFFLTFIKFGWGSRAVEEKFRIQAPSLSVVGWIGKI